MHKKSAAVRSQRTILITGCSSGIGAHCARRLRDDGWRVIASARKPADLDALAADGIEAYRLDYAEPQSIADFFETAMTATGGRCDALFNNGGVSQVGAVEDIPVEALRRQFEVNLFGYHDLTLRVLPIMRAQGHGRIVQCASILGRMPVRWTGAYNASKHALVGLTLTLRLELEGSGIHASLIEPGPIESDIARNALAHFENHVDAGRSHHSMAYAERIGILKGTAPARRRKSGTEAVYRALHHALNAHRPRAHYPVTGEARLALLGQRLLPASLFHRILRRAQ